MNDDQDVKGFSTNLLWMLTLLECIHKVLIDFKIQNS